MPVLICAWYTLLLHVALGTKSWLFNYCIWCEGITNTSVNCLHWNKNKITIHFLDLTIARTYNFQFKIYRKPTTTDAIIPTDSCHPAEHKMSAIRYLHNRNQEYITTPEEKQKEDKIIKHNIY
jgi:hypothetical protein